MPLRLAVVETMQTYKRFCEVMAGTREHEGFYITRHKPNGFYETVHVDELPCA